MIYFTITLTYTQLLLLKAISMGYHNIELKKGKDDIDVERCKEIEKELGSKFNHFVTGVNALQRHGLVQHHEKPYGYSVTAKGRACLDLFVEDLKQSSRTIAGTVGPRRLEKK